MTEEHRSPLADWHQRMPSTILRGTIIAPCTGATWTLLYGRLRNPKDHAPPATPPATAAA